MDAAVANFGSNNMTVLFGDGAGNLSVAANYNTDGAPVGIQSGDVNGDGILDLAIVTLGDGADVFLGQAGGTFAATVTYPTPQAYDVAIADLNNDGNPDLVQSSQFTSVFTTLLGNGDGSFQSPVNHALATNSSGIGIGDFNADGAVDVVAGYNQVIIGNGDGTFQAPATINTGVSDESDAIAVGDIDNDGFQDLFMPRLNSALWILCRGNGNGTFQPCVPFASVINPVGVAVADLTGDGLNDVVIANGSAATVQIFTRTACLQ